MLIKLTRELIEKPSRYSINEHNIKSKVLFFSIIFGTFAIYYFSNPKPQHHFDYTLRIAESILDGNLGIIEKPGRWLNEFIPLGNTYYSVFPLGSVLTMIPPAIGRKFGLIKEMPAALISAAIAGFTAYFLLLISKAYDYTPAKTLLVTTSITFGTWMWTNLAYGGAWQLALGYA